jgi:hypothetical protein
MARAERVIDPRITMRCGAPSRHGVGEAAEAGHSQACLTALKGAVGDDDLHENRSRVQRTAAAHVDQGETLYISCIYGRTLFQDCVASRASFQCCSLVAVEGLETQHWTSSASSMPEQEPPA